MYIFFLLSFLFFTQAHANRCEDIFQNTTFGTPITSIKSSLSEKQVLKNLLNSTTKVYEFFRIKETYENVMREVEFAKNNDPRLTINEKAALLMYTNRYSTLVNKLLREGRIEQYPAMADYFILLQSAISKLDNFNGIVVRIVDLDNTSFANYEEGKIVEWKSFSSSSSNKNLIWHGNTKFIINSKNGKKINTFSAWNSEDEILFLPSAHFIVTRIDGRTIFLQQLN